MAGSPPPPSAIRARTSSSRLCCSCRAIVDKQLRIRVSIYTFAAWPLVRHVICWAFTKCGGNTASLQSNERSLPLLTNPETSYKVQHQVSCADMAASPLHCRTCRVTFRAARPLHRLTCQVPFRAARPLHCLTCQITIRAARPLHCLTCQVQIMAARLRAPPNPRRRMSQGSSSAPTRGQSSPQYPSLPRGGAETPMHLDMHVASYCRSANYWAAVPLH